MIQEKNINPKIWAAMRSSYRLSEFKNNLHTPEFIINQEKQILSHKLSALNVEEMQTMLFHFNEYRLSENHKNHIYDEIFNEEIAQKIKNLN